MLVTNDAASGVLTLSNHGRAREQFWPDMVGFKYKISNIQLLLGVRRWNTLMSLSRKRPGYLISLISDLEGVYMNRTRGRNYRCLDAVVVFAPKQNCRNAEVLVAENIDARVFFWPLSGLPMFESVKTNLVARDIPTRSMNPPVIMTQLETTSSVFATLSNLCIEPSRVSGIII